MDEIDRPKRGSRECTARASRHFSWISNRFIVCVFLFICTYVCDVFLHWGLKFCTFSARSYREEGVFHRWDGGSLNFRGVMFELWIYSGVQIQDSNFDFDFQFFEYAQSKFREWVWYVQDFFEIKFRFNTP